MSIVPACPNCGTRVPFVRTQWGRGTPFACKGRRCAARSSRTLVALVVVVALSFGVDYTAGWAQKVLLSAGFLLIALLLENAVAKPRLAPA